MSRREAGPPLRARARPYESPLRAEQAAATRERILAATARALRHSNVDDLSMAAVAAEAAVAERTVYRYFPNRDDLFNALFAYVVHVDASHIEFDGPQDLEEVVRIMFAGYAEDPAVIRALNSMAGGQRNRARRAGWRKAQVTRVLAEVTADLDDAAALRLRAVIHLLASSDAFLHMNETWGLDAKQASEAVIWAVRTLIRAAATKRGKP